MDNKSTLNFFKNGTESSKTEKHYSSPYTNCGALRSFSQSINIVLNKDRKAIDEEIAEASKKLNSEALKEKNIELNEAFTASLKGKQNILGNVMSKLIANIQKAGKKHFMLPPTPEGILEIDTVDKRFDSLSETELLMLIEKHSDNYQESAYLQSVARKHGKDYNLQIEPNEFFENLKKYEELFRHEVIERISDDPENNLTLGTFFNYKEGKPINGYLNYYADYFDSLPVYVDDEESIIPELTNKEHLQSQLINARQTCWKHNLKSLWEDAVLINRNIQEKGFTIENISKAEKIVKVVNEMFPDEDNAQ